MSRQFLLACTTVCCALLAGCGGGGDDAGSAGGGTPPGYTISATVTGLNGTGLVLRNNGGNDLTIGTNGSFAFSAPVAGGAGYNVTVQTQPTARPAQLCSVTSGSGTVASANVAVAVSCRVAVARFVYAASGSGSVSGYSVDRNTGALTPLTGSPFAFPAQAVGASQVWLAPNPNHQFLYVVANFGGSGPVAGSTSLLFGYRVNADTGALQLIAGTPMAIPSYAAVPVFHPTASLAYVRGLLGATPGLYGYSYDASTGALAALAGNPLRAGNINGYAFGRDGSRLYLLGVSPQVIETYGVNTTTGALSLGGSLALAVNPVVPASIAIHPSANFMTVALTDFTSLSGNSVQALSIDASTGLPALAGAAVPAGQAVGQQLFNSSGSVLYAFNSGMVSSGGATIYGGGTVSAYAFNSANGSLTPLAGSPYATGGSYADGARIDSTGRYLLLTNTVSGTLAAYAINASSGVLTPLPGSPLSPAVGTTPGVAEFDPSGRFVYLVDRGTSSTSSYALDTTANTLSLVNTAPTGTTPSSTLFVTGLQ